MTNYGEIQTEVVANCGYRNDTAFLNSVLFKTNMVVKWLATQREWSELQKITEVTLVVGKAEYTKDDLGLMNSRKVYQMRLYDGSRYWPALHYVNRLTFDSQFRASAIVATRRPEHYTEFGDMYTFSSKPDIAYTLQTAYYAEPEKLTGPNSILPYANLGGAIACLVSGYAWLGLGDRSIADYWFKVGTDLAGAHGIDTYSLLNFTPQSRREVTSTGTPWTDPFARRS